MPIYTYIYTHIYQFKTQWTSFSDFLPMFYFYLWHHNYPFWGSFGSHDTNGIYGCHIKLNIKKRAHVTILCNVAHEKYKWFLSSSELSHSLPRKISSTHSSKRKKLYLLYKGCALVGLDLLM